MSEPTAGQPERKREKFCYVGAPAIFALEQACKHINASFDGFGCFVVGSSLERPDWRDVDVRFMMEDAEFSRLFPDVDMEAGNWEFDERWLLLTVSISQWLSKQTSLPIDFQIQPQTWTNKKHKGKRHPVGLRFARPSKRPPHPDGGSDA